MAVCALTATAEAAFATPVAPEGRALTALVTGSTSGLGREVALRLGEAGAHVIVHGRDQARGEEVAREIEQRGGSARFIRADFIDLDNVRELAATVLQHYEQLDLLVNNAGIGGPPERRESDDGYELTFQVNYLSHFLLTEKLMPLLEAGAPARIINVASGAQHPIDFDDPQIEQDYESWRAYGQSKLAQITFTKALAERLEGSNITTYSLHPETFMPTRMVLQAGIEPQSTIEEGADNLMRLITERDLENGAYFNRSQRADPNAQALDREARERLWALSEELTRQ
ncbi:MAG: SDR family oxidoreductase [Gammaproteobacteria bacterium]|nr:MAG: SDR family oxidoreductase [Gammaproteobacteria bacterium]